MIKMTRLVLIGLLVLSREALAQGTDNHVIQAVPVPGPVKVDGKLDDWDASGRIPVCSDAGKLWGRFSAWVAMMWDAEALYVGVDWCDPTPMVNHYDPDLDIDRRKCFHSDSLQLHFRTDRARKVIGWWFAKGARPAAISLDGWFPWHDNPIKYIDGLRELGITQGFQPKADGAGYTQELRIPWTAIVKSGKAYQANESFDCMLDLVWGPDAGKGWPVNHMMDLVKPGAVHTGWFWEVQEIYGKVVLSPKGKLDPVPSPVGAAPAAAKIPGTIPLRLKRPDGTRFSLAIHDAAGRRVRTLPGDCRVKDYLAAGGDVEVLWDGLDDHGRLVAPGTYQVRGLSRGELDVVYDLCFYNPGTPPWGTADGRGGWGADHSPPTCIAAAGEDVVIGWAGAEGGNGIIGVGPDGRKKWGEHQGALAMTADDRFVWFLLNDDWAGKRGLARLSRKEGAYRPFLIEGRPELPVPVEKILGGPPPGAVTAMAVHGRRLVMAFSGGEMAVVDAEDARLVKRFKAPNPSGLAFAPDGRLFAVLDGTLHRFDLEKERPEPFPAPGLGRGQALAAGKDGRLAVFDATDRQVKVFAPDGAFLFAAGRKGGRPIRGTFDPEAMANVRSVALDAEGRVWAVESWEYPRRVSVWGPDGKLVRDYVGNTAYAACGTYLHDQDPTLAYAGPVEFVLDRAARTHRVSQILWVPDREKGERFDVPSSLPTPQRLTSSASGAAREYLFIHSWHGEHPFVVFMPRGGGWQPAAAIGSVHHLSGRVEGGKVARKPDGEFEGLDPRDGFYWNDANRDGRVQRGELSIVPAKDGRSPLPTTNGWGGKIGRDLTIYADGIVRFKPVSFTDDGAPCYGPEGFTDLGVKDHGDLVPVEGDRVLLVLSATGYGEDSYLRALEMETWRELWRYPSYGHGVHGSHKVSMPAPGRIIGALKICGVAQLGEPAGTVFCIRGNLGEDFLVTTDGFYAGALFRDSRLPGPSLPPREEDLAGKSIMNQSEGSEPFNGWFGRQSDGKVRICTGIPGQAALAAEVRGLETLRRFDGPRVEVSTAQLVQADQDNARRAAERGARKAARVRPMAAAPQVDGDAKDWKDIPAQAIERRGSPERGHFRLAYDERNLYVFFEVEDASPWRNEGRDFARLFKTGDAVDLQLGAAEEKEVGPSHVRLVFAPMEAGPACVLMRPVEKGAPGEKAYTYRSPVWTRKFDRVEKVEGARVAAKTEGRRVRVEASVPLDALGLAPRPGLRLRGDAGFISSDEGGTANVARTYWSNPATNLTSDLPAEAWLQPAAWGDFIFE